MNFLQLAQKLRRECGVSGTGPASVANQTGEMQRLVGWINDAWMDIQLLHSSGWKFLRTDFNFNTIAGKQDYAGADASITALGAWKKDSLQIYAQAAGYADEMELPFMEYDDFRKSYLIGNNRTLQRRPDCFTITPQNKILLGATPEAIYNVNGEYYKAATELVNNEDIPALPTQFHMAIVYKAMQFYGFFEAAPEVLARGEKEYGNLLLRLQIDQLETLTIGDPLV